MVILLSQRNFWAGLTHTPLTKQFFIVAFRVLFKPVQFSTQEKHFVVEILWCV